MKNVMKLALVLLTSLSLGFSANAGDLSVTGTAKATYNIQSSDSVNAQNELGKGLGITNELNFVASGELDNGFTWAYSMELDPSATAAINDDTKMTLTTPYGTTGIFVSEGGLNKSLAFSPAAYAAGIDVGIGGVIDPADIAAFNNIQYHTPAGLLPFDTAIKVAYAPSAATGQSASGNAAGTAKATANTYEDAMIGSADAAADFSPTMVTGVEEFSLTTTPTDGLTVNASYITMDHDSTATDQSYEAGVLNAKYAYGPVTFGYGRTLVAPYVNSSTAVGVERITYVENNDWGIGYAINDNLSVSYEDSKSEANIKAKTAVNVTTKSKNSQEMTSIQAAYTMGGMTLALSRTETDGDNYTKEETSPVKAKETILAVTMAF